MICLIAFQDMMCHAVISTATMMESVKSGTGGQSASVRSALRSIGLWVVWSCVHASYGDAHLYFPSTQKKGQSPPKMQCSIRPSLVFGSICGLLFVTSQLPLNVYPHYTVSSSLIGKRCCLNHSQWGRSWLVRRSKERLGCTWMTRVCGDFVVCTLASHHFPWLQHIQYRTFRRACISVAKGWGLVSALLSASDVR